MSTEDIKSNVTTSNETPKRDVFNYSNEIAELVSTTKLNSLEHPQTIGEYKLLILRATQNFRARVLGSIEKNIVCVPGWEDVITDLVCLSGVIIDNFDKLTNVDDYREFYQIFTVAKFSHQTVNEISGEPEKIRRVKDEAQRATDITKELVEQSIPRYAYLLDLTEDQLRAKMAEKKAGFNKSHTAQVKQEGGLTDNSYYYIHAPMTQRTETNGIYLNKFSYVPSSVSTIKNIEGVLQLTNPNIKASDYGFVEEL